MGLTVRDWMVIVGALLILAVALDAWRRVRSERHSRVKLNLVDRVQTGSDRDADLAWLKELPNGGARVVKRRDLLRSQGHPQKGDTEADEPDSDARSSPATAADEEDLVTGMTGSNDDSDPVTLDWLDDLGGAARKIVEKPEAGALPRDIDPQVFMLNVVARDPEGFRGEDILHILLACDLRFGDMDFFHRHELDAGRGAIQFSVANMMQPGVFDIDNMAEFSTPGLVFFVTFPGPKNMIKAFDYMLETARAVARNLGGDVLDESRSVMTKQALEHCRQQIRDLERRLLAKSR